MFYVCITAHNDARRVGLLLWKARQAFGDNPREFQILVGNDGSTDDTGEVLERYQGSLPITIIDHEAEDGFAATVEELLGEALDRSDRPRRDCAITLDGDFSISPGIIPEFIRRFESGADLVIAEAPHRERGALRRVVRRAAPRLLSPGLQIPGLTDLLSGTCAIRLVTLKRAWSNRRAPFLLGHGEAARAELIARTAAVARQIATIPVPPSEVHPSNRRHAGAVALALDLLRTGRALEVPPPDARIQGVS